MFILLQKLIKTKRLTIIGLYHFFAAIFYSGINLIALLRFATRLHRHKIALVDERESLSFETLWQQTQAIAVFLQEKYILKPTQKVAILCRNHATLVKTIFAVAQSGADIFLLNVEMSQQQFEALQNQYNFDCIITDANILTLVDAKIPSQQIVLSEDLAKTQAIPFPTNKVKRQKGGRIVILTGGTTGTPKTANHKPSIFNFLPPFLALLEHLHLAKYQRVYIPLPIYHGFGLSSLLISIALGAKVHLQNKFEVAKACELIEKAQIEVVTLVPLMLQRMLEQNPAQLKSLACIISGGAALNEALVQKTIATLGNKLANLYGTSEGGFCILAKPEDLKNEPNTLGKPIDGVDLSLLDKENKLIQAENVVGRICVKSKWAVKNKQNARIETGDLAYRDKNGYYFLCGRIDDMIVSGGENVYPIELENILLQHIGIKDAAVIGIDDLEFGQRLKAYVVLKDKNLSKTALFLWLSTKCARFQQPKYIDFLTEIPYTALGKPNKKALGE